jgi:hypothetical protein
MITVPELTPVTTPVALIAATAGLELVHVPPVVASVSVVVDPTQAIEGPTMGSKNVPVVDTDTSLKHPGPEEYRTTPLPHMKKLSTPEELIAP